LVKALGFPPFICGRSQSRIRCRSAIALSIIAWRDGWVINPQTLVCFFAFVFTVRITFRKTLHCFFARYSCILVKEVSVKYCYFFPLSISIFDGKPVIRCSSNPFARHIIFKILSRSFIFRKRVTRSQKSEKKAKRHLEYRSFQNKILSVLSIYGSILPEVMYRAGQPTRLSV